MVSLLHRPSSGRLVIDGVSGDRVALESWRGQIGYVSQDSVIFDDSIANNISMWSGECETDPGLQQRVEAAAQQANISDFIDGLEEGYQTQVGDRGLRLSGGQRQRLFIARELFRSPRLLVLDEATSALDSESEQAIQHSIDHLHGHTTIIIIAHRLSTITNVDQVYVLDQGRVIENGTYQQLCAQEDSRLARLVSLQALT